jgi:hypothetical protein
LVNGLKNFIANNNLQLNAQILTPITDVEFAEIEQILLPVNGNLAEFRVKDFVLI